MEDKHEKMVKRVKSSGKNWFTGIYQGIIIKNKNFFETRKHPHKDSRERKHFYCQINTKPKSGGLRNKGQEFEEKKLRRPFASPSALGSSSTEPSQDPSPRNTVLVNRSIKPISPLANLPFNDLTFGNVAFCKLPLVVVLLAQEHRMENS